MNTDIQASLLAAASQWAKGPMTDAFYSEDSLDSPGRLDALMGTNYLIGMQPGVCILLRPDCTHLWRPC